MANFEIRYVPSALGHLGSLTARQQATVLRRVVAQLSHEPRVESRNRKRMRPNPLASWELRMGDLRVYYDVEEDPEPAVIVLAVGIKRRERVYIGGREYRL
jgi:mRNA-degrading endonuclease RelE of RelBE toxin-antitoxin system